MYWCLQEAVLAEVAPVVAKEVDEIIEWKHRGASWQPDMLSASLII